MIRDGMLRVYLRQDPGRSLLSRQHGQHQRAERDEIQDRARGVRVFPLPGQRGHCSGSTVQFRVAWLCRCDPRAGVIRARNFGRRTRPARPSGTLRRANGPSASRTARPVQPGHAWDIAGRGLAGSRHARRGLRAAGADRARVAALAGIAVYLVVAAIDVLLLAFGGVLVALSPRACSEPALSRRARTCRRHRAAGSCRGRMSAAGPARGPR